MCALVSMSLCVCSYLYSHTLFFLFTFYLGMNKVTSTLCKKKKKKLTYFGLTWELT